MNEKSSEVNILTVMLLRSFAKVLRIRILLEYLSELCLLNVRLWLAFGKSTPHKDISWNDSIILSMNSQVNCRNLFKVRLWLAFEKRVLRIRIFYE